MKTDVSNRQWVSADYYVETTMPLYEFAERVACGQTIGVSRYSEMKFLEAEAKKRVEKCEGRVEGVKEFSSIHIAHNKQRLFINRGIVSVKYPETIFDVAGGLPQILAIVAGALFADVDAKKLRLIDIDLPETITNRFKGPKFGWEGIREKLGKSDPKQPLLGVIMRPTMGLNVEEYAEICYNIALNGADFIKDDEKFVNADYCSYEERIPKIRKLLNQAYKKTGNKTIYIVNITTSAHMLNETAERVEKLGADIALIASVCVGLSAIQSISEDRSIRLPIYGHRAGYAAFARSEDFGIETLVLLKILRLVGVDMFSVGIIGGVQATRASDIRNNISAATNSWFNIKASLPVCTAGMHPGLVPLNMKLCVTSNIAIFAGWGVHGHPRGVGDGVKAMKQAIEATLEGKDLEGVTQKELCTALKTFGLPPKEIYKGPKRIEP